MTIDVYCVSAYFQHVTVAMGRRVCLSFLYGCRRFSYIYCISKIGIKSKHKCTRDEDNTKLRINKA